MSTENGNPCIYKKECKTCIAASELTDRPHLCIDLKCSHYTPCTRCQNNRTLNSEGVCNVCVVAERKKRDQEAVAIDDDGDLIAGPKSHLDMMLEEDDGGTEGLDIRTLSSSVPGIPPSEYSEQEKQYYKDTWESYTGFYRDPTTKFLLHSIIILEIEINLLMNQIINNRSKGPNKTLETQRRTLIRNLHDLRKQLPEKEANEESDDEKFMSMVYDAYVKEKSERQLGKVSRVLSPEAIALAPTLEFPVNPRKLLQQLGYRVVDAAEACESIVLDDLPSDPEKVLEFFGFFLKEHYALPIEQMPEEDYEPPIPVNPGIPDLLQSDDEVTP